MAITIGQLILLAQLMMTESAEPNAKIPIEDIEYIYELFIILAIIYLCLAIFCVFMCPLCLLLIAIPKHFRLLFPHAKCSEHLIKD